MFGRKIEKDPQKALDNANKTLNNPLLKGVTQAFLGNDFVEQTDNALAQAQVGINIQKQYQAHSGLDATAEVLSIEDTGKMVNMNPVVKLKLKAQPMMGMPPFEIAGETIVSKISIPRVGDTIKIKYNPVDPTQFTVAQ